MASGKTKHIMSYKDAEHVFMALFPELILTQIKKVHKVYFETKYAVLLIELKNGIGIRFTVKSIADSPNRNHKVKILYENELIPSKYMPECLEYVEQREKLNTDRSLRKNLDIPAILKITK